MKSSNRSSRGGFTLIEVMAALMILSIALVVLIRSQTESLNNVMRVQNYERAVFITENQLHWTFIDLNEAEDWREYESLNGVDGDYKWRVTIEPQEMEDSFEIEVTYLRIVAETTWPEGRSEQSFRIETGFLWGAEE